MSNAEHYVDPDFDSGHSLFDPTDASQNRSKERSLFASVIIQALLDIGMMKQPQKAPARKHPQNLEHPNIRSAVHWLLYDRSDFAYVCELAGVEHFTVRTAARDFLIRAGRIARHA